MSTEVFLSLGSNLGNRKAYLSKAVYSIEEFIKIKGISPIYESPSYGFEGRNFYNICLRGCVDFAAPALIEKLLSVEQNFGRVRKKKSLGYQNRIIDLDILLFGSSIILLDNLEIPHKAMLDRRFVLQPLTDIAPNVRHPIKKKIIKELLEDCSDKTSLVKLTEGIPDYNPNAY